jgi:glucose/arabinose dehydrogenase
VADGTQTTDAFALAGVAADEQGGLTTIAIDPRFERTRFVYVVYTAEERDGPVFRVVRLREAGGRLGEPAVIRQEPAPPSGATAVARFGPDQRLYVGASAGRDAHDARTAAAALGTILRLNDDGTTPRDNPRPSPVFSTGHRNPQGLAWHPAARTLWMVDRHGAAGDEVNLIAAGADYGWPPTRGSSVYPGVAAAAFSLPGVESSGAAFGPAGTPLEGDLLVGAAAGQDLLRLRVDATGARVLAAESLLDGRFGRVGAVASVPGAIYFITVNRDGRDRLVRLTVK